VTNKVIDPATGKQFSHKGVPNMIDPARFSPVALNILNLIPLPNVPNAGLVNNFVNNTGFAKDSTQFDVKVDTTLRNVDHLTLRYSYQDVGTLRCRVVRVLNTGALDALPVTSTG
jgi:hypothetical protein